jgi:lipoprotein-anchoring transpeptidase ErfK/SrfK
MRSRLLMIAAAGALLASCAIDSASGTPAVAPATTQAAPASTAQGVAEVAPPTTLPPTTHSTATTVVKVATLASPVTVGESGAQGCKDAGRTAVVDRKTQRAWLCQNGTVTAVFPITSANDQPNPGHYKVYAKDMKAYSTAGGHYSTMTHFVAFTRGIHTGARVAFHSAPKYRNGSYVEPLDQIGNLDAKGESSGCIRVRPDDAQLIWDTLRIGDSVVVVS